MRYAAFIFTVFIAMGQLFAATGPDVSAARVLLDKAGVNATVCEMPRVGDGMLAAAPVATIGEPVMAGAAPAVALSRYGQPASGISARAGRRAGRRSARAALIPVAAAPAATHSLFRPWGLPVGAQP